MGLSSSGFTLNHLCLDFPVMAWVLYPPTSDLPSPAMEINLCSCPWAGFPLLEVSQDFSLLHS